jgi:hypothetical protein
MTGQERLADEARRLVGCRFRLHGRDPASGLDCMGVLAVALQRAGYAAEVPLDYTLKTRSANRAAGVAQDLGLTAVRGAPRAGDILMMRVGPEQLHFALCVCPQGFVHAHAGLREVVLSPALPAGAIVGHWRAPDLRPHGL